MKTLMIQLILAISLFANIQVVDDIGYVDDITINGREFESLEQQTIEFYPEDLENGKVVIQGLLESQDKNIKPSELFVEISLDGGDTWTRANGHEDWEFSFTPEIAHTYEFSLRITKGNNNSSLDDQFELPNQINISGFVLTLGDNTNILNGKISGSGTIQIPWLENAGLQSSINVNFSDIQLEEDRVVEGSITYSNNIDFTISGVEFHIDSLTFSPDINKQLLSGYISSASNTIISSMGQLPLENVKFSKDGLRVDLTYANRYSINIWENKGVKIDFRSITLDFAFNIYTGVNLLVKDLDADLNFGTLLNGSKQKLTKAQDELGNQLQGIFNWGKSTKDKLISDTEIYFSNLVGKLDLNDILNPSISFAANVDLSNYSSMFASLNNITINNIEISKDGLSASVEANVGNIDIWKNKGVALEFVSNPNIELTLNNSGFDIGFSGGSMQLNFGTLIDNVTAEVNYIEDNKYRWIVSQENAILNNISLSNFYGDLDISSLTNPQIVFNANADLSEYGGIFSKIKQASISDATISKDGLSAQFDLLVDNLMIWEDKKVQLVFNENSNPSVHLDISSSGDIDFGFDGFDAKINFGTLLPDTVASINQIVQDGVSNLYQIGFDTAKDIYLIDNKVKLSNIIAKLDLNDLSNPKINFNSLASLSGYTGILSQINQINITDATISKTGFSATASVNLRNIDIYEQKGVKLTFKKNPSVTISVDTKVDFSLNLGSAKLEFGELLNSAIAELTPMQDEMNNLVNGVYSWGIKSSKNIIDSAKLKLKDMKGILNLSSLSDPKIIFGAKADLSQYGGAFNTITHANVLNAMISKDGFSGEVTLELNDIDIYKAKNVKLHFNQNPKMLFSVNSSGFKVGLEDIDANINFGDLLNGQIAQIRRVADALDSSTAVNLFEDRQNQTQKFINNAYEYAWSLTGNYPLLDDSIELNTLSGSLDFSDLSNPNITLNANVVFNTLSYPIFKYVNSISLTDAVISRDGFSANIGANIDSIPIYKDKNVKIIFDEDTPPIFSLAINSNGLHLGVEQISGEIDFGTLIDDAKAQLSSVGSGILSWSFSSAKNLANSSVVLKNLGGLVNLQDLKNPIIELEGKVNLSSYFTWFESLGDIDLQNATISKAGFSAKVSAQLEDITIWSEKQVKVLFANGTTPTFSLAVNRDGLNVGVSNIDASLDFGTLISTHTVVNLQALQSGANDAINNITNQVNQKVSNISSQVSQTREKFSNIKSQISQMANSKASGLKEVVDIKNNDGIYSWSLSGEYPFTDSNGVVRVSGISGIVNLKKLTSPIVSFDASGDFSQYTLPGNVTLQTVQIDDATISKSGIDWHLAFSGLGASYVIYDLGEPTVDGTEDESDVRIVLTNADGNASNSGVEIGSASGFLSFGDLFDQKVEPIQLTYESSGVYGFSTTQVLTFTSADNIITFNGIGGKVQKIGSKYKVIINAGDIVLQTTLMNTSSSNGMSIRFSDLEVSQNGFKGTIVASWGALGYSFDMINGNITLNLKAIGVNIDTSTAKKISLSQLDGSVDLSTIFDQAGQDARAALALLDSNINWSFSNDLTLNENFIFKNISGDINFSDIDALSVGFNGSFGYKGWDNIALNLNEFNISRSGLHGSISLDGKLENIAGVDNLDITQFGLTFLGGSNISGNIGMDYKNSSFLGSSNDLDLGFSANIGLNGIDQFALRGSLPKISINNFARMNFTGLNLSPSLENFSMELSGNIQPSHDLLKSLQSVEFAGLKISKSGISVSNIAAEIDVSGAKTTLGGFALSLDRLALGYKRKNSKDLLYIKVAGELGFEIAQAGAGVSVYSDGSYTVDKISLDVSQPALSISGTLQWYDNDSVYGDGFSATGLHLSIANMFDVEGRFRIGSIKRGSVNNSYWMAEAMVNTGGSGIPLAPLPISIYGFGGGVAYGMRLDIDKESMSATYIPNGTHNIIISAAMLLGTSDAGYTWHGKLGMYIDLGNKKITLTGNSCILTKNLNKIDEDKFIGATVEMTSSPFSIYINGSVNVLFKPGSIKIVKLTGSGEIYYSSSEKYIYLGTKENKIQSTVFSTITAASYLMIDDDKFAIGTEFYSSAKWEGEACCCEICGDTGFGIGYDSNIGFDATVGYGKSMYIDLAGHLYVDIEGRVAYTWFDIASFKADIRFRTPNPTFFSIYINADCCGGSASHTFYIIGNKDDAKKASLNNLNLLKQIYPIEQTDVSILPYVKIETTFRNDGDSFKIGKDDYTIEVSNAKIIKIDHNTEVAVLAKVSQMSPKIKTIIPVNKLTPNGKYKIEAVLKLKKGNSVKKRQNISKEFTVTSKNYIKWSRMMNKITPEKNAKDLDSGTSVSVFYSPIIGTNWDMTNGYDIKVYDVTKKQIEGRWSRYVYTVDGQEALKKIFVPNKPLKVYHFCKNIVTGEIKETVKNQDGKYLNPFRNYTVDGEESSSNIDTTSVANGSNGIASEINPTIHTGLNLGTSTQVNDSYVYYTENKYTIKVHNTQENRVDYISSFEVADDLARAQQQVSLINNINSIESRVLVNRNEAFKDGTSHNRQMLYMAYDARAKNGEFQPCVSDMNQYMHGERTCDTCGDCKDRLNAALQRYKTISKNIDSIYIDTGISRDEYPNILPIVEIVFQSENNSSNTITEKYIINNHTLSLQRNQTPLLTAHLEGTEILKSATVKYYLSGQIGNYSQVFLDRIHNGSIEPLVSKQLRIIDDKLEDVESMVDDDIITNDVVITGTKNSNFGVQEHSTEGVMIW
jgi:hypothetical protein